MWLLTPAVTVNRRQVTHWNQGEWMAPFSALRNGWQPSLHPYHTRDLCPVSLCLKSCRLEIIHVVQRFENGRKHVSQSTCPMTNFRAVVSQIANRGAHLPCPHFPCRKGPQ